ncbi:MAG: hypothetical protein R3E66_08655 [bacterium]
MATVSAPRLDVGNRKMAAGFGNRGRLDSMDVLGETSPGMTRNTPPSPIVAVEAPVAPATASKSDTTLKWTLGVLVVLIVVGLAVVIALMNRTSSGEDAVAVEPAVPAIVDPPPGTPEQVHPAVTVVDAPKTSVQVATEEVAKPERDSG